MRIFLYLISGILLLACAGDDSCDDCYPIPNQFVRFVIQDADTRENLFFSDHAPFSPDQLRLKVSDPNKAQELEVSYSSSYFWVDLPLEHQNFELSISNSSTHTIAIETEDRGPISKECKHCRNIVITKLEFDGSVVCDDTCGPSLLLFYVDN